MKSVILAGSLLLSTVAHADLSGTVVLDDRGEVANLILNESSPSHALADLYASFGVKEDANSNGTKTKVFKHSSGRFEFKCERVDLYLQTDCVFKIHSGPETNDVNTVLQQTGSEAFAAIGLGPNLSKEFEGIFSQRDTYMLDTDDRKTVLEVDGNPGGSFVIAFLKKQP